MIELRKRFDAAAGDAKKLPKAPSHNVMLQLYALFKQANGGDVTGGRPGFTDMVGRTKYDAWTAVKGTSAEDAMQQYIGLIESLRTS